MTQEDTSLLPEAATVRGGQWLLGCRVRTGMEHSEVKGGTVDGSVELQMACEFPHLIQT
jgi:hypothetical protein